MFPLKVDFYIDGPVYELDLDKLKSLGIKGLILDLDNTIMLPKSAKFCSKVKAWLSQAQNHNLKIVIVSNNKNDFYLKQITPIIDEFSIPIIFHAKKPRTKKMREAVSILDLDCEEICMIGDRVLTDVWAGKLMKMKTAIVKPLIGDSENSFFKVLRKLEYIFMQK
jgi:HAD superfamily phosphatase (TIGR01668 family)